MGRKLRGLKRWFRRRRKPAAKKGGWLYDDAMPVRDKKSSRASRGFIFLMFVISLLTAFGYAFYRFDRRILPLVLEAAELRIQTEINNVINSVVHDIIVNNEVTAADFILRSEIVADGQPVLSVNTVLVNEICNAAAQAISERLNNLEPEVASVPIGMVLGLDTLAQTGPKFTFSMAPTGNALVNYETDFTAVGINQTHFSVWLTVESVVRIIKIMYRKNMKPRKALSNGHFRALTSYIYS